MVFDRRLGIGPPVDLPCGQCIGCRLERSRQWAVRMCHEAQLYDDNCFITLTYSPENVPPDGSLNIKHFQDFMKRLRSRFPGKRIRFFHCGEYGERFSRPHYHACLFGFDFPDKVFYRESEAGGRLYTSAVLESLWRFGFCPIGDFSFESAAYVARYVTKKVTGAAADDHYWRVNDVTGEAYQVAPEYCTMSRRPGIGAEWFERFSGDVFPRDEVVSRGFVSKPPRYYDELFGELDAVALEDVKSRRVLRARDYADNNTPERLFVREVVKKAQVEFLRRRTEE